MRIVYLVFAENTAYVTVVEKAPKGVEVFPDKGEWKWPGSILTAGSRTTLKIGENRYIGDYRGCIIGVYDLDDIRQASSMVHAAIESQRDYSQED